MHLNFQYRELALALSRQLPSVHLPPVLHTEGETLEKMKFAVYGHLNVHIFLSLVHKHVDKTYRKEALNCFDYDIVYLFTLKILIALIPA